MAEGRVMFQYLRQPEKLQHLVAAYAVRQLQETLGEELHLLPVPDLRSSLRKIERFQFTLRAWIQWAKDWLRIIRSAVEEHQGDERTDLEAVELNVRRFDDWLAVVGPYSTTLGLREIQHLPGCTVNFCNKFTCSFRTLSDIASIAIYPDWILVHRSHSGRIEHIEHMGYNLHMDEDWEV